MTGTIEILCGIVLLLFALYYYYTVKFNFWKKRNVPGPKAIPFFGTIKNVTLGRISMTQYYKDIYDAYKDMPLVGIFEYSMPVLFINDPELIKNVLIRDSVVFGGRGLNYPTKAEPMKNSLINMNGKEALSFKAKMSPIFTPKNLKSMVSLFLQRSEVFKAWLDSLVLQNKQIDCREVTNRLTADFSATCIFGYDIKTIGDEESDVLRYINKANGIHWRNKTKQLLARAARKLYDLTGYYLFDNAEITNFFIRFFTDIVKYREKYGIDKHDVVSELMKLKQNPGISDEFIAAQNNMFLWTSFETTATVISNTLYELCFNQSIQDRLCEEIRSVYARNNGEITLDDINAMSYLDATIKETLRKYPIVDILIRQALSDYTFTKPQVFIPKGQLIIVPIYALHHDPEIYPSPEVYNPERFLDDTASFKASMFYAPFGHGPRSCIAKQYAVLQTKIGLMSILQNYKVSMLQPKQNCSTYGYQAPLQLMKDMHLKLTKIC